MIQLPKIIEKLQPLVPDITIVGSVFLLALLIFRSLLFNLETHLLDWNDYPYYVWTISQNLEHIRNLQFDGFFNTNSFYPHQGTLLFSDILLPQSIIAWVWEVLLGSYKEQPILLFNLTFFTGIFFNIVSAYILAKRLFVAPSIHWLATITLALSPFFFTQFGHLQMITFWPGLLALSELLKNNSKSWLISALSVGMLLSLQVYASVYLALFIITCAGILFFAKLLNEKYKKRWLTQKSLYYLVVGLVFVLLAGPLLYKYKNVQDSYGIGIVYSEYVYYAAHVTDYIFFIPNSLVGQWLAPWNSFNLHTGGEPVKNPSLIISFLAILGIFFVSVSAKHITIKLNRAFPELFFLLLLLVGLVFSLGPRLNVNGYFATIPLPYHLLVKQLPIMEPIRATSRWYFVFYLGVWYFAMKSAERFGRKSSLLTAGIIAIIFLAEVAPLNIQASSKNYYPDIYDSIAQICQPSPLVLLEFPITPFKEDSSLIEYLQYRTGALLASSRHGCLIVNGYSGLTPKEHIAYDQELFQAVQANNLVLFVKLLASNDVSIIKFNSDQFNSELGQRVTDWLHNSDYFSVVNTNETSIVVKVNK